MRLISDLITEREMLDFSQGFNVQRNYTGSRLLPDRKTQYIEAEYTRLAENGNLPTVAMIHGFDTEAHIGSRVPFERVETESLLIKEKINLSERLRRITRGLDMQMDSVRRYVFDDIARTAESVVSRVEKAKMEALATGKMTINENNVSMVVDFGVPDDQKVTAKWAVAAADILGDIDTWVTIANGKGQTPTVALTSKKVFSLIQRNASVQKAIFGVNGTGVLPSLAQVNNLLAQQFDGLTVQIDEERYGIIDSTENPTTVTQGRFFPEDKFVLLSTGYDGSVGTGLWGVTPEELEQGGAFDEKRQQQFVTCTRWDTPDPVATWTKASGVFIPVLPQRLRPHHRDHRHDFRRIRRRPGRLAMAGLVDRVKARYLPDEAVPEDSAIEEMLKTVSDRLLIRLKVESLPALAESIAVDAAVKALRLRGYEGSSSESASDGGSMSNSFIDDVLSAYSADIEALRDVCRPKGIKFMGARR